MNSLSHDSPNRSDHVSYLLRHADDNLILSHRVSEWISNAPDLEEDIALANLALDLLGVARPLLGRAGVVEGEGRTEDDLAFGRTERQFLNLLLVEQPNRDFAHTIVRQFVFDCYQTALWAALARSTDDALAGVAGKAAKETAYHLRHSRGWLVRLGDGTDESHRRMQAAVDELWRFTPEMFTDDDIDLRAAAAGVGVLPSSLEPTWRALVAPALTDATLSLPDRPGRRLGGRAGRHSEHMGHILPEMQHLHRALPGAAW